MQSMLDWFGRNYTWLFSGVGAVAIGWIAQRLFRTKPNGGSTVADSTLSESPVQGGSNNTLVNGPIIGQLNVASKVDIQLYERRLPIYEAAVEFVRYVVCDLRPKTDRIIQFSRATEQALFLFDRPTAEYLNELSTKAFHLHALVVEREGPVRDDDVRDFAAIAREECEISVWFTQQYEVIRQRFEPFLHLV